MSKITPEMTQSILKSYKEGNLKVKSASQTKEISWEIITKVMRHESLEKEIYKVILEDGRSIVVTSDHSLFTFSLDGIRSVRTDEISIDTLIVVIENDECIFIPVKHLEQLPRRKYMYDLSVPGNESFVISHSGILAHNSYSIGGVSLDIDKSSKYQGLADTLQSRLETMLEHAHATIKLAVGVQQPRYGIGVKSQFGPALGPGISSPRNFIRF